MFEKYALKKAIIIYPRSMGIEKGLKFVENKIYEIPPRIAIINPAFKPKLTLHNTIPNVNNSNSIGMFFTYLLYNVRIGLSIMNVNTNKIALVPLDKVKKINRIITKRNIVKILFKPNFLTRFFNMFE